MQFDPKQFQKQINQRAAAKAPDLFFIEKMANGNGKIHRIKVEDLTKYSGDFVGMSLSVPMYSNVSKV